MPTLKILNKMQTITKAIIDKPMQLNTTKPTWREPMLAQTKLHNKINDMRNLQTRIAHKTHMQLCHQKQQERIQLIQDEETGEYLNY